MHVALICGDLGVYIYMYVDSSAAVVNDSRQTYHCSLQLSWLCLSASMYS